MDDFGPAMLKLAERHQRFVLALAEQIAADEDLNFTEAARRAGANFITGRNETPEGSYGALKITGHRWAHREDVIEALTEFTGKHLRVHALTAAQALTRAAKKTTDPRQLQAAGQILDRTGHGTKQRIEVAHTHRDLTAEAMVERIEMLARKHGLDPQLFLGGRQPMKTIEHREKE